LESAVETSRPLIEAAGHEFRLELPEETFHLDADPVRLAQVFANLLNNAAKYTPNGGRIRIKAERRGPALAVSVEDDGMGISPDMLPRLFDLFSQAPLALAHSKGGLGIGLSLVKGLVEMHGGRVEAQSDGPGRGSTFTVYLPIDDGSGAVQSEESEQASGLERRILVVDDSRDTANSMSTLLRLMGHTVHTAYDGEEAVLAAERYRPDVVVLDIGMPRLNGYDACRQIRAKTWGKGMFIVAVTGWGQETDRQQSQAAGFDGHLVKPVQQSELAQVLNAPVSPPLH
jgi:CheY-like chemotaxis protein